MAFLSYLGLLEIILEILVKNNNNISKYVLETSGPAEAVQSWSG